MAEILHHFVPLFTFIYKVYIVQVVQYFSYQQDDIAKEWFQSSLDVASPKLFFQKFQNWRTEDDDLLMFSFCPKTTVIEFSWELMKHKNI